MSEATTNKQYFFDDVNDLVKHLFRLEGKLSPIKLQKALYFLFAYYGATYGSVQTDIANENKIEQTESYPKYLFNDCFEAWKYGPVISSVYKENKQNTYEGKAYTPKDNKEEEVLSYINEIFQQLNEISDFGLVERSHLDMAWKEPYSKYKARQTESQTMNNEIIIEEYRNEYL
ncbi:DUF4065 domain-containing protein [Jeotgalibaca sp. MA1X17-3]|uniref:Panacea domain-containing protein n=1 Tax=Jeotgalibaca sp. MA1X17-3 TaxID=2908211 RepID=UPI001F1B4A80|nr:type II toxin-antitoxin system antitoxin SocA domain-containing protein [Jeotgalibaca sp. MA1X17-3]UJF15001.1 DUF4065 domain-containing protein [Jeotgalibaca sp. MA1X17-3]